MFFFSVVHLILFYFFVHNNRVFVWVYKIWQFLIKFAKNFSLSTNFKIGRCASSITKALALNKFAHFKRVLEFQAHIKSLNQIIIFFSHILCFKLFTKRLGKILLQFIITMKKQNFLILEKAINFLKIVWNVCIY